MANDEERVHTFPPFPDPPSGVKIVPFGEFRPMGYRHITGSDGEEVEVDAWVGIPTVKVLSDHEASQKRKSKKKKRTAGNTMDAEGRLIPWWEEWEEGEALRAMSEASFDDQVSFEDRVCLAADDFRVGRTWPEIAHGVRNMWDQFRLYIGLISSAPIYKKIKNKNGQVDGPNNIGEASDEEEDVPRAKQTKMAIVQDYLEQSALPGKQLEPDLDKSTVETQRLRAFLDDIEKSVKVFLSSYMCDTGLIWTERNLVIAPTVLHFFLRFMLRNGVFADSKEYLDNLKRAVDVAASARKELPLTANLGQMLPGKFDLSCKECWGTKGNMSIQISATLPPADISPNGTAPINDNSSMFETELKEHDVEVVPSDVVLDSITARQVMEDNLDDTHNIVPVTKIPVTSDPWTAAMQAEECTTSSWTDVSVPCLMHLLGPTTFPLTMTTGVVEHSTRRIREMIAPGMNLDQTGASSVSAVEEVLQEMFFRVVMSPWVGSAAEETADFPRPVITSGPNAEVASDTCEEDAWDPYCDDVTILVDGDVAMNLVTGMGLCGTWVQMVPEQGSKHPRECYWYVESLVASLPSYYTEGEAVEEGDEED